ncbi:hypothetical protein U6B65_01335 [Oscillospiraceae bacterium MB08-C2-2]|nr:hypothetical protein U6B65_01335 [Oscillospiraceae bacterium MB08-C2-2]
MKKFFKLLPLSCAALLFATFMAVNAEYQPKDYDEEMEKWPSREVFSLPAYEKQDNDYSRPANGIHYIGEDEIVSEAVTYELATLKAKEAGDTARKEGKDTAYAQLVNAGAISQDALSAMTRLAGETPLVIQADTLTKDKKAVDVRLNLSPALSVKALNLRATTNSLQADGVKDAFTKKYDNWAMVICLGQREDFGQTVEVAVKNKLASVKAESMYFYTFNSTTGQCVQLENTGAWLDSNGYLHFNTTAGGNLVVSDGALRSK